MSRSETTLAILFADVSGSTKLYERIGDQAARDVLTRILGLLEQITHENGGTVIKTIGDEIMCTFPEADAAAQAAWAMQDAVTGGGAGDGAPDIKVGFHFGPVIAEDGDVHGDAVNVAARIASHCKPRQILTTGATIVVLDEEFEENSRLIDRTTVRGRQEPVEIFELLWEEDESDLTCMPTDLMTGPTTEEALASSLELRFLDAALEVTPERGEITIGRGRDNDLVVPDAMASRVHAVIRYFRGKFVLIDQSTNGTFVATGDGRLVPLRREEFPLMGEGFITLGREADADQRNVIRYCTR